MTKSVVRRIVRLFNREVCTVPQLQRACNYVVTYAKTDSDGVVTLAEALDMLARAFREVKKGN